MLSVAEAVSRQTLPDFLPGALQLTPGTRRDYQNLRCFHYLCGDPATFASIWTVRYFERAEWRVVAAAVLSYPVPSVLARRAALGLAGSRPDELRFANRHIRTVSRVIVHPQFRSLGLSTRLIECLCVNCDTRYVEAIAQMGRVHPLFDRAGFARFDPPADQPDRPVYFLFDRHTRTGGNNERL